MSAIGSTSQLRVIFSSSINNEPLLANRVYLRRMWFKNLFPRPSPRLRPFNDSSDIGKFKGRRNSFLRFPSILLICKRRSGTSPLRRLGQLSQTDSSPLRPLLFVIALNNVDLPAFAMTIPAVNAICHTLLFICFLRQQKSSPFFRLLSNSRLGI